MGGNLAVRCTFMTHYVLHKSKRDIILEMNWSRENESFLVSIAIMLLPAVVVVVAIGTVECTIHLTRKLGWVNL